MLDILGCCRCRLALTKARCTASQTLMDVYDTAGIRTTCHSKLRVDNVSREDSVVATKLKVAGGVLIG